MLKRKKKRRKKKHFKLLKFLKFFLIDLILSFFNLTHAIVLLQKRRLMNSDQEKESSRTPFRQIKDRK